MNGLEDEELKSLHADELQGQKPKNEEKNEEEEISEAFARVSSHIDSLGTAMTKVHERMHLNMESI